MHGISLSETHGKSYITPEWRLANWLNIYRSNEYLSFCSHQWVSLEAWKQRYFLYKIICFNKHAYVVDGIFFLKSVKEATTIGSSKINIHEKGKNIQQVWSNRQVFAILFLGLWWWFVFRQINAFIYATDESSSKLFEHVLH